MTTFFISDQHYRHHNILDFEQRPYRDIQSMEEDMVDNWNSVVGKIDTVYMLGDFCFGKPADWIEILDRLKGKIILIKGNHDKTKIINRVLRDGYLEEYHGVGELLKVDGYTLNLTHYPMAIGHRPRNFNLHGHIHSRHSELVNQINLGVDSPFMKSLKKPFGTPVALEELMEHVKKLNVKVEEKYLEERGS